MFTLAPGEEGRENETMSKWGKRKQSYASDGDSDDHAPSKKSSMKDSDDPDNIIVCEVFCFLFFDFFFIYIWLYMYIIVWRCLDFEEQEGFSEELAREGSGGYSRVLRQRWQANAWQKRYFSSSDGFSMRVFIFLFYLNLVVSEQKLEPFCRNMTIQLSWLLFLFLCRFSFFLGLDCFILFLFLNVGFQSLVSFSCVCGDYRICALVAFGL